jgi:hypothetical protein
MEEDTQKQEEVTTPEYTGHCFRCKKETKIEDPVISTTKNNRTRVSGKCSSVSSEGEVCGKNVSKFIKSQKKKETEKEKEEEVSEEK